MEVLIKNMVCRHCVAAVERIFKDLGIGDASVTLGAAHVPDSQAASLDMEQLDKELRSNGFERIVDRNSQIVEQVKRVIIRHVRIERNCPLNVSACLEKHLDVAYDTASRIFSAVEGRTIERYFIVQKIELVKELLAYNQMTLSEIADMTGYSSVSHLSRQFKEVTGMTPSQYLRQPEGRRKPLSEV